MGATPLVLFIAFVSITSLFGFWLPKFGGRLFGKKGIVLFGLVTAIGLSLAGIFGVTTNHPDGAKIKFYLFCVLFGPAILVSLCSTAVSYRRLK